jgi:ATP-dependent Lhr-like helicase
VLEAIHSGDIRTLAIDTPAPSLLSHEILSANPYAYLDNAPAEERRARAVQLRSTLRTDLADGEGVLDPQVIAQVAADSWPPVRDPDELHDALLTLITLPPVPQWEAYFVQLVATKRATELGAGDAKFWVAAERLELAQAAHSPQPTPHNLLPILCGWLESSGPARASELAARLALPRPLVDSALVVLEAEGQVLRGQFTGSAGGEIECCNRRILARIHRLTLGKLRHEIEPVTTADFVRFLTRWQHVAPGTQLHGVEGAFEVIRQLEAYELSAAAWESQVLPRRIARYSPEYLDRLCLSGELVWGRLSQHPALNEDDAKPHRVRPTRLALVAFLLRTSATGTPARVRDLSHLSHPAREVLNELTQRGASFFTDLLRGTGRLASEVEDALWELVAAGLVTADGFENLRALVDPKRRRGEGRGRRARPRHAMGRWALLNPAPASDQAASAEAFARLLLRRWGVIFRDLLARETLAPPWRELLVALRRLEARGEIRGGRFVAGFAGEQYALPEAVQLLRAVRRDPNSGAQIRISTADPLNLAGIILPGPRLSTLTSATLVVPL